MVPREKRHHSQNQVLDTELVNCIINIFLEGFIDMFGRIGIFVGGDSMGIFQLSSFPSISISTLSVLVTKVSRNDALEDTNSGGGVLVGSPRCREFLVFGSRLGHFLPA